MTAQLTSDVESLAFAPPAGADRLTVVVPCDPAYDTPGELGNAIRRAAPLLGGRRLVVLAMWRSIAPAAGMAHAALPAGMVYAGVRNADREQEQRATESARAVVAIAQECGLEAIAEVRRAHGGWATSVAVLAGESHAGGIVVLHARRVRPLARALKRAYKHSGQPEPLLLVGPAEGDGRR